VILEGIMTTLNRDGTTNISPMGPVVDEAITTLRLRPYKTSRTYENLVRTGQGIFHVIDDPQLLARATIDRFDDPPEFIPATAVEGNILADACRWLALRVETIDDLTERATVDCQIVDRGRLRDFWGWNRARHAVLEAAILATRVLLIPADEIRRQYSQLQVLVDKTAGERERQAFELLREYVEEHLQ
jgi:hypothetical protein